MFVTGVIAEFNPLHKGHKYLLERAKAQVTVRDIMDDFQISGLLNVDKSKNGSRTKKLAGKRCYVISYDVWKSHVRDIIEADDSQR